MKHTMESLEKINQIFLSKYYKLDQSDIDMANNYTKLIEKSRSKEIPAIGDVVRYTTKYGEYYSFSHINSISEKGNKATICEQASPSINKAHNKNGFSFLTSGGAWCNIPCDKMKYIGKIEKIFWDFGHCGACVNGAIYFNATVNIWEYNENRSKYSTKERDKYYIYKEITCDYHYIAYRNGMSFKTWRTEHDLQVWLRTFKTNIESGCNSIIAWAYKEIEHSVSPDEFKKINGIEDTILHNGIRICKRIYDDTNSIVHTYFVWYWNDPSMGDFSEQLLKQNEIRKQYELRNSKENSYAINELVTGKVKPIKIKEYFKEA